MSKAMHTDKVTRVHFIGVGGVGMSGIARVASDQGMQVSGSDIRASHYTDQLASAGVKVFIGQRAENIPDDVDVVVVSTAIMDSNPEYAEAKRRGIPIWHRAKMLAQLGVGKKTLAVAGTHGKTTTSSMLATVTDEMGAEPTFLVGGIVSAYETNAHSGAGPFYVVEADESDKSFTYLDPYAAIVTNIEPDHLDHYKDLNEIYELFETFMSSVADDGVLVVCGEDERLVSLAQKTGKQVITYGFGEECDVRVESWEPDGVGSTFNVVLPDGRRFETSLLYNPGRHNVLNATAVLALCDFLGMDAEVCACALKEFAGVHRRFDMVGERSGVTVVDDYAHHPTEIAATIAAAKQLDYKAVHVLFQPHRYSRAPLFTEVLHDEFSTAFDLADRLTFMDVYPAGETPVPGVNGKTFLDVVLDSEDHPPVAYVPRRLDVARYVAGCAAPGTLVITMGAGDVTAMGPQILDALDAQDASGDALTGVQEFPAGGSRS